jgi:hypothetical protein
MLDNPVGTVKANVLVDGDFSTGCNPASADSPHVSVLPAKPITP